MRHALLAIAVSGLLAYGTVRTVSGKATPVHMAAAQAPMQQAPETAVDVAKRLALQEPHGHASVDTLIANLQRATEHNPTKGDFWVVLGRAWVRKARETTDPGFYLNAKGAAEVALDLNPNDPTALDLVGFVLLNDHRFEEARALAQRIVESHPVDPSGYGTLSDALLELGRFQEAAAAAQTMMDLKPNLPSYSRAAYLRWLQGDVETAKRTVRLAIDSGADQRDPEPRAWVLVQAAMTFWHEGDVDGAEAGFDAALAQMTDYPPALVGKGRVALARGDGAKAAEVLRQAYAASPLVETGWLLGDALALSGDEAGAKDAYVRIERTGKQSDPRTLALYWTTKGEHPAEALALAEKEKSVRGDLYTEDAYAWALYRNGRLAEARAAVDRALAQNTPDAKLIFHSGAIRIALGNTKEGRALIAHALALQPHFDVTGADEARRILADAKL
jgi:tetratricopeptide (TPR) repeat protein